VNHHLHRWFSQVRVFLDTLPEGATTTDVARALDPNPDTWACSQARLSNASKDGDLSVHGISRLHFRSDHPRGTYVYYTREHAERVASSVRTCQACGIMQPVLTFSVTHRGTTELSQVCNACRDAGHMKTKRVVDAERKRMWRLIHQSERARGTGARTGQEYETPRRRVKVCKTCWNAPWRLREPCPTCGAKPRLEAVAKNYAPTGVQWDF